LAEALSSRIVEAPDGCWLWTGYSDAKGYGRLNFNGRPQKAHRAVYEALVGPIPDGLQLDHLCRVRGCVNPAHLEPVTLAENVRRGLVGSINRQKTHCPRGHEYTVETTYTSSAGKRHCKVCANRDERKAYRKAYDADPANKERKRAYMREWKAKRKAEAAHVVS
jgi:hypothetical protein